MPEKVVSEVAFTKARARIPLEFFKRVFTRVKTLLVDKYGKLEMWKGLHVKIIDGTTLTLPESDELRRHFGSRRNQHKKNIGPVQAIIVAIFSAFTGACSAFSFGAISLGEATALLNMLKYLGKGDLLLGDRVFQGCGLWDAIIKQGADFLLRLKKGLKPKRLRRIGERD